MTFPSGRARSLWRTAVIGAALLATLGAVAACGGADGVSGPDSSIVDLTVEISQSTFTVGVGRSVALQAIARGNDGQPVAGGQFFWSSSDSTVARVSATGLVTGLQTGTAQIAASLNGRSAVSQVTVAPQSAASIAITPLDPRLLVGQQVQLSASVLDQSGAPLLGRAVSWTSSDSAIAVVDSTGRVTGVSPGLTAITAASEGRQAAVGVTVSLVPVATITLAPAADTVVIGQNTQLRAILRDSAGATLDERALIWRSRDESVAQVSSSGLVLGVGVGVATITAEREGRVGEATIVVDSRPVETVIVSPAQVAIGIAQTQQLTVQLLDASGILLTGRAVAYRSNAPSVASVSPTGIVTGNSAGTTIITASVEGKSGSVTVSVARPPIASLTLEPADGTLFVGETLTLRAVARDAAGNVVAAPDVGFSSGSPAVARVDSTGLVRAVSAGNTVIVATSEGRVATANITVRPVSIGSVLVSPATATVFVGDALDLATEVRDINGFLVGGRPITWTTSDNNAAVVSSTGRMLALVRSTVQVLATVDGVTGLSTVTIIPEPVLKVVVTPTSLNLIAGASAQLTATALGRNDIPLPGRVITFQSTNPAVATVSSNGAVSAVAPGTTTIVVESEGQQATVTVAVSPAPVTTVQVQLAVPSLQVGQTTQATATLRDQFGNVLTGRAIAWTSSALAVATVSSSGVVTAVAPGTAVIRATSEGVTGAATVTVSLVPVASVSVALAADSLFPTQTTQATATLRDAAGNVLTGRPITWTSSNSLVATVSSSGVVTALLPGTVNITASSEGIIGSAGLAVRLVPVASVSVTLSADTIFGLATTQATAVLRDSAGNLLTGRPVVWSSSDNNVATVSNTGVVTGGTAGNTTIAATSEGMTGSAPLHVLPAPVATVTVTLAADTVTAGSETQATAVLRDAAGTVLTGRVITWTSSNETVAAIAQTGVVAALEPGTTVITATSEGQSNTAVLTVTPVPVATVNVTLDDDSLSVGETTEATAELLDGNGDELSDRVVTWTSEDTLIARVSDNGVVTAVAPGTVDIVATSEGQSGRAVLTVILPPVETVAVAFFTTAIVTGEATQATATLRDADDNVLTGRVVEWSSSDTTIASVNASGLVMGLEPGEAVITATSEGKSGGATITVVAPIVARVEVAPTEATVNFNGPPPGRRVQLTAKAYDALDNEIKNVQFTWVTSDQSIASVNGNGLVNGQAAGTAIITASAAGQSATATITVTNFE